MPQISNPDKDFLCEHILDRIAEQIVRIRPRMTYRHHAGIALADGYFVSEIDHFYQRVIGIWGAAGVGGILTKLL